MKNVEKSCGGSYQHDYESVPQVVNEFSEDDSFVERGVPIGRHSFLTPKVLIVGGLALLGLIVYIDSPSPSSSAATSPSITTVDLWGSSREEEDKSNKRHHHDHHHHHDHKENKRSKPKILEEYQIPHYFNDQLVDHFAPDTTTWSNRYYVSSKYFKGPGHPLIVIMGGEGPVDEVFYPFVKDTLAQKFGAYVLQTEHRFYGTSIPTKAGSAALPTNEEFLQLLSPDQALEDFVRIIRHIQGQIGCSADRTSAEYCPILTVGASYPGFLSAMMRFVYPDLVDFSYASSAPLHLYAQTKGTDVYFDYVTHVAEVASPGCAAAHIETLEAVRREIAAMSITKAAKKLGICSHNIPHYITTPEILADELTMMVGFANADFNMDYHPPGDPKTDVIKGCQAFQQDKKNPMERLRDWLVVKAESGATGHPNEKCYDLHWDIPSGPNATITGADWSGMGDGDTANTWEFQCCKDLIIETGFGENSMFLERPFDLNWLSQHCQDRFHGVVPQPTRMVDNWHFDDLVGNGGSHILFTNGLQDAWSPLSHTENLSDTIVAINMPTGAHHSDLNECCKGRDEEEDILQAREQVAQILGGWINELKQETQK